MMNSVLENFTILLVTVLSLPCFDKLSHEAGGKDRKVGLGGTGAWTERTDRAVGLGLRWSVSS